MFLCAEVEELLCRSVWSGRSGVRSADRAFSQCRQGEEMMSCSSYAPDGAPAGQTSSVRSGSPHNTQLSRFWCSDRLCCLQLNQGQCVAYNRLGVKGVHAVARCCVVRSLEGHAPSLECRLLGNTSSDNDQVRLNILPPSTVSP